MVTGGSRGIGRMIAEGLLAQGARVYISARKVQQCEETAGELGPNCIALPADLSTVEGVRQLAGALAEREQSLDILVNNAGAAWGSEFETFPESGWDKVFNINVKAPFFLTQALHPMLKSAARPDRPAKVITIGSIDGLRVSPWEAYSCQASKAAVHHLVRRMAARLIGDNIVATAIAPGFFLSEMNRADEFLPSIPALHTCAPYRTARGYRSRSHLSCQPGRRLCRRRDAYRRRRGRLCLPAADGRSRLRTPLP